MIDDRHVDGNALGGLFHDLFGQEMTNHLECCGRCGTIGQLARLLVYRGAGDVLRCPRCHTVLFVAVSTPAGTRLSFGAVRWLEYTPPPERHVPAEGA